MPLVTVKMFEHRLHQDPQFAERLAIAIDEVVAEHCTGPDGKRPDTWVTVEGVPRTQWTFSGQTR
ncbi:hypothetical protein Leucomu_00430 [Leucobacter muris]|uniref:4-oxalocrotonate tautomerase domain-containing protein n=1 Tax=Leucobacter muris TaxID=1935379 RepID=A0ABX5QC64_9MICO|nr:hypothetical protein [Leucobacter muris]QAB16603.1 hypothetical protein Leucomu_00430 [Leucobacter muris]